MLRVNVICGSEEDQGRLVRGVVRRVGSWGSTSSIAICDVVPFAIWEGGGRVGQALWAALWAGRVWGEEGGVGLFYVH